MGMGYAANYVDCVEIDFVRETCPEEFQNLEMVLDEHNYCLDQLGQEGEIDDIQVGEVEDALDLLEKAFYTATGLTLSVGYHSSDDGDRYDDVQGFFFSVEGAYQLSPAGERNKEKIERKFFVTFG